MGEMQTLNDNLQSLYTEVECQTAKKIQAKDEDGARMDLIREPPGGIF